MVQNILITGGAGYIGGSIAADFASRAGSPISDSSITVAVRSKDQVQPLEKLGLNAIKLDLTDEQAVTQAVLGNNIDIIVHTASSIVSSLASNLINGLGERRKVTGGEAYFIQSSVLAIFSEEGGWPYGEVKDSDPLLEKQKQLGGPHPVRLTNILVTELAKSLGVTSFNVALPQVYGRGSGEYRQLSVSIPAYIRTSIKYGVVYKFDKDGSPPATHISDLVALYGLIVEHILQQEPIPNGENGYYFPMAHRAPWWEVMQRLAQALHTRGLVNSPQSQTWPSYEMAAEYLKFPLLHLPAMATSSGQFVPVNAFQLGWQPKWSKDRFLDNLDEEIQGVLDLDKGNASVFDSLLAPSNA